MEQTWVHCAQRHKATLIFSQGKSVLQVELFANFNGVTLHPFIIILPLLEILSLPGFKAGTFQICSV